MSASLAAPLAQPQRLQVRQLGRCDYQPVWQAMQQYTRDRKPTTPDQCWLLEHEPVYTLGLNGKRKHLLWPGTVPVVQTDRGGQVTYHGPGQLVMYLLLDLRRLGLGVQQLVRVMEQLVIDWLASQQIDAESRADAPGVYVGGAKLASLGLRVKHGCCYHGLSLNIDMDLTPFEGINPCGHAGLAVTQLRDLGLALSVAEVAEALQIQLASALGYTIEHCG